MRNASVNLDGYLDFVAMQVFRSSLFDKIFQIYVICVSEWYMKRVSDESGFLGTAFVFQEMDAAVH